MAIVLKAAQGRSSQVLYAGDLAEMKSITNQRSDFARNDILRAFRCSKIATEVQLPRSRRIASSRSHVGLFRCQALGQAEIEEKVQNSESQPSSRELVDDSDNDKNNNGSEPGELVELGSFTSTHGLRGELKFQAISDSIEERLNQDVQR